MSIGLGAFSRLLKSNPNSRLTMVGEGPAEELWKRQALKLKINDKIQWIDWLPSNEVEELYKRYNILLLPSLHDSGRLVVLESMSYGMPVVCLNLGGPGKIVTESSGIRVDAKQCNRKMIESALSKSLIRLARDKTLLSRLSYGAFKRSKAFTWEDLITSCYGDLINSNGITQSNSNVDIRLNDVQ